MKKFLLFIAVSLCAMLSQAQQTESRVALVIGNSAYKTSPLKNPVNDAADMSARLKGFGFTVIERNNLTTKQIGSTLREFRSKLTPGSVALVFYAGHGVTIKGKNYLPAVDAEINGEEDVPNQSLGTEQIMDVLAEAKTRLNLVFLDACRDNPYARSFRSTSRGLSRESAPSGTLISFATKPGSVAADGTGRNGLYTSVLLEQIKNSGQPIEQVLKKVVTGVRTASKNQQEPWMEGSIEGDFCFGGCGQTAVSQVPAELTESQKEDNFWNDAKAAGNVKAFEAYLEKYPSSRYSTLAKANIERLSNKPTTSITASTQTPNSSLNKFKDCDECPEMVVIPVGSFLMGSPPDSEKEPFSNVKPVKIGEDNEKPQHRVNIQSFLIGKFEITQGQWYALMGNNPSSNKGRTLPVENVSWDDAQLFVQKLSQKTGKKYRLPSEAEWEYSARGGSTTTYPWGNSDSELHVYAWFKAIANATNPVGLKTPNQFGLHDMLGNVWEWTQDCWNANYNDSPTDGSAWVKGNCSLRVLRGGSWIYAPLDLRSASRNRSAIAGRLSSNGFRVARDL